MLFSPGMCMTCSNLTDTKQVKQVKPTVYLCPKCKNEAKKEQQQKTLCFRFFKDRTDGKHDQKCRRTDKRTEEWKDRQWVRRRTLRLKDRQRGNSRRTDRQKTDRRIHSCTCSTVPPSPAAMNAIPTPAPPKTNTETEHSREQADVIHASRSGLTILSRHSAGAYQGNEFTRSSSGYARS